MVTAFQTLFWFSGSSHTRFAASVQSFNRDAGRPGPWRPRSVMPQNSTFQQFYRRAPLPTLNAATLAALINTNDENYPAPRASHSKPSSQPAASSSVQPSVDSTLSTDGPAVAPTSAELTPVSDDVPTAAAPPPLCHLGDQASDAPAAAEAIPLCRLGARQPGCMRRCCIKRKRNGPETDDEEQSQEEGGPPAPVHARVASLHFGHKPPPEERLRPSGGNHFAAFGGGRFGARRQQDAINFGISLASNFSPGTDLRGFVAMEKFDGVRATWEVARDPPCFRTRRGNELTPPPSMLALLPRDLRLDGELWLGRGRFEQTWAAVQRPQEATWSEVKFMVFDAPGARGGFEERLETARERLGRGGAFAEATSDRVQVVGTRACEDVTTKEALLEHVCQRGGEGLILRRASSRFVAGHSPDLFKCKRWLDAEAKVLKYRAKGKDSLRCQALDTGVTFDLTWNRSTAPPPPGSIVSFAYQLGLQGGPRFPKFLRERPDLEGMLERTGC